MTAVETARPPRDGQAQVGQKAPPARPPAAAKFNLLDLPLVRRIIESRFYPGVLQVPTVLVFAVVIWQLLLGPATAHENFGTAMTWVLWWPLIPIFFLLAGRFWCAICPFATVSDLVQKVVGHNRAVPAFLKKWGIWIIDALFIAITWADHVFGIVESPRGSGYLLLGLVLGVVTVGSFFERRTWCRYLCFLGGLSGNYSRAGTLELRATPEKCSQCKAQACYRGNEKAPGCPMFEFPRVMDSNAKCNFCGYCVKSCPNNSITLSPRLPTQELWSIRRPRFEESFLACVIMGVVFVQNITMLGVWGDILAWLERTTGTDSYFVTFTIAFAVAMALPILALFGASYLANLTGRRGVITTFTLFGYALIPLDLAGHVAHNLFHLLAEGKSVLYTALSLFGIHTQGSAALLDNATIQVLQYLLVLAGVAGSVYTAYRLAQGKDRQHNPAAAWVPIVALFLLLGAINLYLFYLPMEMRM
ncbi:MAG: 4Fe-4S binding protein [Chloroflexota bacterium]